MRIVAWIGAAAVLLAAGAAEAANNALVAAAEREGRVTWYTSMIVESAHRSIAEAFERKYGIAVQRARGDDATITLKILNEMRARNLQADVFDGFSAIPALRKAGYIEPYIPPSAHLYPPEAKDPDGYWTGINATIYVPVVNTTLVPPDRQPKSYGDLLDPFWKGNMAWNPTNSVGAPLFVGQILRYMGRDAGMEFLRRLGEQDIAKLEISARAILDRVIAGDYALGLMLSEAHAVASAQAGAPVAWLKLDPAIVSIVGAGTIKNAPHPNAAKLLVDFLTSEEGQTILSHTYVPALPSVAPEPPIVTPRQGGFAALYVNGATVGEGLDEWGRLTRSIFR